MLPHALIDGAVEVAAQAHLIDCAQARLRHSARGGNLAGVELVGRVERSLDGLQGRVQLAKIIRHILRTQALAMLAPQQPAVALRQGGDRIRQRPDQRRLGWVLHVQHRPDMQHAGIDMAKHAVLQAMAVEQRPELGDVLGQILRGHCGVFDKRLWPRFALHVTQQAHRAFAHGIHAAHRLGADRQGMPQPHHRGIALKVLDKVVYPLLDLRLLVAAELDDIDAQGGRLRISRKVLGYAVPDDVLHCQHQHFGIYGFDRQRLVGQQGVGVTQGIHEPGVAHIDQY